MLCLIWCVILYTPTKAVNMRIDGTIDLDHNWGYKFPPFAEILRMSNISATPENSLVKSEANETLQNIDSLSYIKGYTVNDSSESSSVRSARNNPLSKLILPFRNIYIEWVDDSKNGERRNGVKTRKPLNSIIGNLQAFIVNSIPNMKTMRPGPKPAFKSRPENLAAAATPVAMRYRLFTKEKRRKRIILVTRKLPDKKVRSDSKLTEATMKLTDITIGRTSMFIPFEKKHKKRYDKSVTRKRHNTDPAETKYITKRRTSKFHPKLPMVYYQQALSTVEPVKNIARSNVKLVKNNEKVQTFTINVFRQNIGVFNALKSKIHNTKLKNKIGLLAHIYRDKFGDFVESNQNNKIATRIGTQKVVLNTIETSSRIMRRLINLFISVTEKVFIPDKGGFIGHWGNQVDNEEKHEYAQACENMKICRSKYTFSSFLADIVAILLKVNNEKLKQATDAITEVLNNIELSDVLDKNMQTKIPKYIEAIEKSDPDKIKIVLSMFRNMLVNKNKPLVVRQSVQRSVINQTVSLMDLIDLLDAKILATDDNVSKWNDLKNRLTQWANGQGSEILEIMQDLVKIVVEGVKKMNKEKSRKFYDKLQMFLRSASSTYQVDHTNPARNATVWKSEI